MGIIKKFSAENKRCFSYKDVITEYPDKDHSYLSKVLAAMVRLGMLMKLSLDVYKIPRKMLILVYMIHFFQKAKLGIKCQG